MEIYTGQLKRRLAARKETGAKISVTKYEITKQGGCGVRGRIWVFQ